MPGGYLALQVSKFLGEKRAQGHKEIKSKMDFKLKSSILKPSRAFS